MLEIICLIIMVFTILLHSTGIYILLKIQTTTNQRLFLMNLSAGELFLTISDILHYSLDLAGFKPKSFPLMQFDRVINAGLYSGCCLLHIIMTIDRLIAGIYPLEYSTMLSRKRTKVLLACSWLSGFSSSVPFFFLPVKMLRNIYYYIIHHSLQILFLFCAVTTYSVILSKLIRRGNTLNSGNRRMSTVNKEGNSNFYLTAGLIILSFAVLVVFPCTTEIILHFVYQFHSGILEKLLHISWALNFMVDAIIYILFQPQVRVSLKKTMYNLSAFCKRNKVIARSLVTAYDLQPSSPAVIVRSNEQLGTSL